MQLDPRLSKTAIFAADRRADVTVTLNAPITEALGQEAQSLSDSLKRSAAAALAPYPDLSVEFSVGRVIADSQEAIRHFVKSSDIGPTLEMHLFDIMQSAVAFLHAFDEAAFVTASITQKPSYGQDKQRQKRDRIRWWRAQ